MATNLDIDPKLISEAKRIGGHSSKRETVEAALRDYVARKKQQDIIASFGKVEFAPGYDYKKLRKR